MPTRPVPGVMVYWDGKDRDLLEIHHPDKGAEVRRRQKSRHSSWLAPTGGAGAGVGSAPLAARGVDSSGPGLAGRDRVVIDPTKVGLGGPPGRRRRL